MSNFLGWSSALIPSGTTVAGCQSTFSSLLASISSTPWQIIRQGIAPTSVIGTATNPSNAMDMSSTSYASGTVPISVGANISAGFTPVYMYVQCDTNNFATYAPLTFTLDYSSNGSSWTTLQTFTGNNNWFSTERRRFTVVGATSQTYWRINVTAVQSGSTLQLTEWILEDSNKNWLTNASFFDCLPPTTETVGNSYARELVRWIFSTTSLNITPIQECLTPLPQLVSWDTSTAGAVTLSITLSGSTVSYTGVAANTALQNARGLYEACITSSLANFTAMNWWWSPALSSWAFGTQIFWASQKTPAQNILPTSSNITTRLRGTSVFSTPMAQFSGFNAGKSITIDLTNGWVYYLQVCSRGLAIASKTNSGFYGPTHACYGDSASSLAQLPVSEFASIGVPCTPIELFVGQDPDTTYTVSNNIVATHLWGSMQTWTAVAQGLPVLIDASSYGYIADPFTKNNSSGILQNYSFSNLVNTQSNGMGGIGLVAMPEGYGESYQNASNYAGQGAFNLHRMSIMPAFAGTAANYGYLLTAYGVTNSSDNRYTVFTHPSYSNLDWYKFFGTAPSNEQLIISPVSDYVTSVSITGTTSDTTINVTSTTGFPSAGYIALETEIIQYSGTTSTSFTGCTRGKYASTVVTPILGTNVYIAGWFCFIISGLLFAGYQLPS